MQVASFWQITLATDPGFLIPILGLYTVAPNLFNVPFTNQILLPLTVYLARVTYLDNTGAGLPGPATAFMTLADGTLPFPGDPWVDCV